MDVLEAIRSRRSVGKVKPDPLPRQEEICAAAVQNLLLAAEAKGACDGRAHSGRQVGKGPEGRHPRAPLFRAVGGRGHAPAALVFGSRFPGSQALSCLPQLPMLESN